jgi:hypothetical protein
MNGDRLVESLEGRLAWNYLKGAQLWLVEIPLPVILLIALFVHPS